MKTLFTKKKDMIEGWDKELEIEKNNEYFDIWLFITTKEVKERMPYYKDSKRIAFRITLNKLEMLELGNKIMEYTILKEL